MFSSLGSLQKKLFALCFLVAASVEAQAAVKTETFDYNQDKTVLEGYLAQPAKLTGKRPGILIVHEWTGLGDFVKNKAQKLAEMGYIAFGVDVYGKGVRPSDPKAAGIEAAKYKDNRGLMRARMEAGLQQLLKNKNVDPQKIVVIGYCFGGTAALELGRSGAPLAGIVTFHGGLSNPKPEDAKKIKASVLVLHGAIDPFVNAAEVAAFEKEMNDANVDYQLVKYSGAVHSFTNPKAGDDIKAGAAYNPVADKRSWVAFEEFLKEKAPLR